MSEIILAQTLTPAHFPSSLPSRNIKFISFVAFVSALEAWLSAFARSVSKRTQRELSVSVAFSSQRILRRS